MKIENETDTWGSVVESILTYTDNKKAPRFDINFEDEIICKTQDDAYLIADLLEALLFDVVHAKPIEDAEDSEWKWVVYPD